MSDGLATYVRSDGPIPVIIERPAALLHGERYFVVRHEGKRVWQIAPASALERRG